MSELLDPFGSEEYDVDCIYTFCDVSLRDREERKRHMIDRHGHSWKSANESVEQYADNGEDLDNNE